MPHSSVSGNGLRILRTVAGEKVYRKQKVPGTPSSLETYRVAERYIVVTGTALDGFGSELRDIDAPIDRWVARLDEAAQAERERARAEKLRERSKTAFEPPRDRIYNPLDLPPELDRLIRYGAREGERSTQFMHVVGWLKDRGLGPGEIEDLLAAHPHGIAERYAGRLRVEIDRAYDKAETKHRTTGNASSSERFDEAEGFGPKADQAKAKREPPPSIVARPYVWRDPRTIPRCEWVYGHHLIRRFISTTVAPGAVGKSSLTLAEAVALATGRDLLGIQPTGRFRVWVLWNGEDPLEELERRVGATLLHYGIKPAEIEGRLFLNSGRDTDIVIATTAKAGTVIAEPVMEAMKSTIRANEIDVVVLDPFVACHGAGENDNVAINAIAKTIARMAEETGTAWDLVHHSRKTGGAEITVEDGRGASALLAAARAARVLNPMSKEEAEKAGIERPRGFFRVDNGKANLAPPPDKSEWFTFKLVSLENAGENPFDQPDQVAVVTTWQWPDPQANVTVQHLRDVQAAVAAGRWRENHQAKDWVGHAVGPVLGLDPAIKAQKQAIIGNIKIWLATGMLTVVDGEDEKRNKRSFVEVGEFA